MPPLSGRRRLAFAAFTLAFPVLALAALEGGLRAVGYGDPLPLVVPYEARPEYRHLNERFARRYFPAGPFVPGPMVEFFRAERPAGGVRLVFQGESSAQGFPYGHNAAPSRMLEQRLAASMPGRPVEVINTAFTAITSYALLDQADAVIAQRPDAVLIYAGHNEYYGALGAASSRAGGRSPALVRAYLALQRLRLVQLAQGLLGGTGSGDAAPGAEVPGTGAAGGEAPRTVMQLMAGRQRVAPGSALHARGIAQFRDNLGHLLDRYRAAGIPVFVGTLASNERDQPPLAGGPGPGTDRAAWERALRDGQAALARGDRASARDRLLAAVRLDSTAADGRYALARALEASGDTAAARREYRAARDLDQLRFRAPEAMNAVIREVAARHGATVVETQRALERASPGGIVGRSLMLEHLHPNVDGYFLMADAFYEALRARGTGGRWATVVAADAARRDLLVTPMDSLVGALRTDRLRAGWPFQPAGVTVVPAVDTLRPRTSEERHAQAYVLGTQPWAQAMEQLREEYARAGRVDDAVRVARAMALEYRYSAQPYRDAARLAAGQGRWVEAAGYARLAAARQETHDDLRLAGLLLVRAGDHAAAVPYLERLAQRDASDPRLPAMARAARVLPQLEAGRRGGAREPSLLYSLAAAYALTEQPDRAREALGALFAVEPSHPAGRELERRLPPAG